MRREVLMAMTDDELEKYASVIGANVSGMEGHAAKVAAIEERRERTHEISLLGAAFTIPTRNIRDKRFQDAARGIRSDEAAETAARLALGDDQWQMLVERVTDEDGVVDIDALGMAIATILNDSELKNY